VADFLFDRGATKVIVDNGGTLPPLERGGVSQGGIEDRHRLRRTRPMSSPSMRRWELGGGHQRLGEGVSRKASLGGDCPGRKTPPLRCGGHGPGKLHHVEDPDRRALPKPSTRRRTSRRVVTTQAGALPPERVEEALQTASESTLPSERGLMQGGPDCVKQRVAWTSYLDSRIQAL